MYFIHALPQADQGSATFFMFFSLCGLTPVLHPVFLVCVLEVLKHPGGTITHSEIWYMISIHFNVLQIFLFGIWGVSEVNQIEVINPISIEDLYALTRVYLRSTKLRLLTRFQLKICMHSQYPPFRLR